MKKNIVNSLVYCVIAFVLAVLIEHVFGVHNVNFTKYPVAEDFALLTAVGLFIGLQNGTKNQGLPHFISAVLYCVIAFVLAVLIEHVFGVHNVNFTKYPVAEDVAVYITIGRFFGIETQRRLNQA